MTPHRIGAVVIFVTVALVVVGILPALFFWLEDRDLRKGTRPEDWP